MPAQRTDRTALRERPGGVHNELATPLTYMECDLPDGVTLREWRRSTIAVPRRRWRR